MPSALSSPVTAYQARRTADHGCFLHDSLDLSVANAPDIIGCASRDRHNVIIGDRRCATSDHEERREVDFLQTHPYLIANIPTLFIILALARFIRPRACGRLTVLAGLACVPCSLIAFTYEGEYWNPVRLGGIAIGIEDVIYCFAGGALHGWRRCGRSAPGLPRRSRGPSQQSAI